MLTFSSKRLAAVLAVLVARQRGSQGFVVGPRAPLTRTAPSADACLFSTAKQQQQQQQHDDVSSMRASEIKRELESYGISTKSFLEKTELVDALSKARADGLKPKEQPKASSSSASSSSSSNTASSTTSSSSASREERLQKELEACRAMKVSELKKELQDLGLSTRYFEKSEFVDALAQARVDGISKKQSASEDEGYAEYADVEVLTDTSSGPRQKQSGAQSSSSSAGGRASSPFGGQGGGASPFGGMGGMGDMMGGMGGIADMLKNFGGSAGGAGGANPFGGAGGANPFGGGGGGGGAGGMGDMMGKAQEMMKNPKIREIVAKAQSNPKVMAAVNECMSNPAAFSKYQNDPEISGLLNELRKYM